MEHCSRTTGTEHCRQINVERNSQGTAVSVLGSDSVISLHTNYEIEMIALSNCSFDSLEQFGLSNGLLRHTGALEYGNKEAVEEVCETETEEK
jgi:hypothetical protein